MEVLQCRYLVLCYSTMSVHEVEERSVVLEENMSKEPESSSSSFRFLYYSLKLRDPSTFSKVSNSPSPLPMSLIGDDAVWRRAVLLFPSLSSHCGCTLIRPRPPLLFLSLADEAERDIRTGEMTSCKLSA